MSNTPSKNKYIPFSLPFIGQEEKNEVLDTLGSGWITTGPKTKLFEDKFKEYTDSSYAVALSSCTAALHLSLLALDIGPGDEVITTPFTFIATVNAIVYTGATPVLIDIRKDTLNIDWEKIEEKISTKTKAIIPVHYAGQPCEMDKIIKIARKYKLCVIEDAAHALGAEYKGMKIGSIGDLTCFSFYPTKSITTGEGGMVTTNRQDLADKIRILSLHGMDKDAWKRYGQNAKWFYDVKYCGYKYNMTDLQAAIGIPQLKRLENFIAARNKKAQLYDHGFSDIEQITTPRIKTNIKHARHIYPILLNEELMMIGRNEFIEELGRRNIGASVHFIPVHIHSFYKEKFGFKEGSLPVAESSYKGILSLPLYSSLPEKDIHFVIKSVKEVIKKFRK